MLRPRLVGGPDGQAQQGAAGDAQGASKRHQREQEVAPIGQIERQQAQRTRRRGGECAPERRSPASPGEQQYDHAQDIDQRRAAAEHRQPDADAGPARLILGEHAYAEQQQPERHGLLDMTVQPETVPEGGRRGEHRVGEQPPDTRQAGAAQAVDCRHALPGEQQRKDGEDGHHEHAPQSRVVEPPQVRREGGHRSEGHEAEGTVRIGVEVLIVQRVDLQRMAGQRDARRRQKEGVQVRAVDGKAADCARDKHEERGQPSDAGALAPPQRPGARGMRPLRRRHVPRYVGRAHHRSPPSRRAGYSQRLRGGSRSALQYTCGHHRGQLLRGIGDNAFANAPPPLVRSIRRMLDPSSGRGQCLRLGEIARSVGGIRGSS